MIYQANRLQLLNGNKFVSLEHEKGHYTGPFPVIHHVRGSTTKQTHH